MHPVRLDLRRACEQLKEQRVAECQRHARELFRIDTRLAALERVSGPDVIRAIEVLSDLGLLEHVTESSDWQPSEETLAKLEARTVFPTLARKVG